MKKFSIWYLSSTLSMYCSGSECGQQTFLHTHVVFWIWFYSLSHSIETSRVNDKLLRSYLQRICRFSYWFLTCPGDGSCHPLFDWLGSR
ncbi:hypothetical protein DFS34DRAFT_613966 [Phlyctochytrium arcticum]|nr:hypothetical protein DFS34DRAFT_613966 [Phlyctochytrium arcticum]